MTTFLQSRDPARPASRKPVKMELGLANFHDGASVVFLQLTGDDRLFISPAEARMVAGQIVDQANAADEENGVIAPLPHPQNLLVGLRIGEDQRPVQVSVVPTWGPIFYSDAAGARALARMLDARADELDGAPLPEPCALCGGSSRAFVPGTEGHGGEESDCPLCTPEDPIQPNS